MLEEIKLNAIGETLQPHDQEKDEDNIELIELRARAGQSVYVGKHKFCDGLIYKKQISEKYYALSCENCSFRMTIPNKIKTWKQLKEFFDKNRSGKKNNQIVSSFNLLDLEE